MVWRLIVAYSRHVWIWNRRVLKTHISLGYDVHIITDGTSSSKTLYRSSALQTLAQYGIILNTSQGVLFELLHDELQPQFKEALKLLEKYKGEFMIDHLWLLYTMMVLYSIHFCSILGTCESTGLLGIPRKVSNIFCVSFCTSSFYLLMN